MNYPVSNSESYPTKQILAPTSLYTSPSKSKTSLGCLVCLWKQTTTHSIRNDNPMFDRQPLTLFNCTSQQKRPSLGMVVNTDKIMTMTSLQDFPDIACLNQPQLMAFGTLVVSSRLMPPHLVGKSHTHWPPLSIVSVQQDMPPCDPCNAIVVPCITVFNGRRRRNTMLVCIFISF